MKIFQLIQKLMIEKNFFWRKQKTANMATTTLKDLLSSQVSDFLVNHASACLCDWLRTNKGVECTPQELCCAFGVTYTPRATMAGLPQAANMTPQMPNVGYMTGVSASPRKATGGGRKKTPADPNGPKCSYQFQRGDKKGQVCGLPVANNGEPGGDQYCKQCLKKKTVQTNVKPGAGGGSKKMVPPPMAPGGMVSVPDQEQGGDNNTIKAVPIEGHPGMFKDLETGFILKQEQDGSIIALGVDTGNSQRPLTHDEKRQAHARGLGVVDSPQASVPVVIPGTAPVLPQVPFNNIPTIPQLGLDHA